MSQQVIFQVHVLCLNKLSWSRGRASHPCQKEFWLIAFDDKNKMCIISLPFQFELFKWTLKSQVHFVITNSVQMPELTWTKMYIYYPTRIGYKIQIQRILIDQFHAVKYLKIAINLIDIPFNGSFLLHQNESIKWKHNHKLIGDRKQRLCPEIGFGMREWEPLNMSYDSNKWQMMTIRVQPTTNYYYKWFENLWMTRNNIFATHNNNIKLY